MDVGAKGQAVLNVIGRRAAIRLDVSSVENGKSTLPGYRAPAGVRIEDPHSE